MVKTEENIRDLVKYLVTAADIAGGLSEDQTLSNQHRHRFDKLYDRLRNEWISIVEAKAWSDIFGYSKEDKYEIQD